MAIAAGVWLLASSWHGRIARRRSKGWPPGALRILPLDAWFDRSFFFEQSRRLGSPSKTSHFLRPMVCFVGFSDGGNFLKEHESVLAREVYEPLEPFVRESIRRELNRIVTLCESQPSGVGPRSHIQRIVFAIWAQLFFNISNEAGRTSLKQLYKVVDIRNPMSASAGSIDSTLDEIERIVRQQLHDDKASRGVAPRSFFEALAIADGDAVDDQSGSLHPSHLHAPGIFGIWRHSPTCLPR
jgi:hypothetical protein